jgi:Tfp pilus assembly protein PilF
LDKALADLAKAIELDPKLALAWSNRSNLHLKQRQWAKAVVDASKAIDLDPKLAMAWNNRGWAHQNLGQPQNALVDYSKAVELNPQYSLAWQNRANLYKGLAQWERATADYTTAIKHAPSNGNLHNNFAWLLATCPDPKFRDPARAVQLARKATEIVPKAGVYWNTLGVAHYRAADWRSAKTALEKSMALSNGGSGSDWFFVAMVYWKLDEKEESRKWYDRAAQWVDKNNPRDDQLRRFRVEASELLGVKNQK